MPWIQTHLTVDRSQTPLIELLLEQLGALSISLTDAGDEPMLEPAPGQTPLWSATRITGLFDGATDVDWLRGAIGSALQRDVCRDLEIERLDDRDWERCWLDQFKPMRFGQRLWICPSGHQVNQRDAVVVDLDPGLAFGTGTHPTTELCLRWLDAADLAGRRVIDFGCGSGILAIAALKLGAASAIGIDHDPQALAASRDNALRNGVAERFEVAPADAYQAQPADLVLANILANVLIELQPEIAGLVTPGGDLVLSGILAGQASQVAQAYLRNIPLDPPQHLEDWVLLHGNRGS